MEEPTILNVDKSNSNKITFDIENTDTSFVNAIRRSIITDVTTVGFDTDDYQKSDLKVIENTSTLHNEFLLHRLGLVPIYFDKIEDYDESNYKFVLNKQNTTDEIINVTTGDIEIINLSTNQKEPNSKFFPKNKITDSHILLNKLKPNPDKNGEKIHIEGKSSKGNGKKHIRYSPVSNVLFINKRDPKRVEENLKLYLQENMSDDNTNNDQLNQLKKTFELEEADRYFYIDENGEPNIFSFTIESCGVLKPHRILIDSVKSIISRLKKFNVNLDKVFNTEESSIEITESQSVMKSYDIVIHNETHTLGNLLQTYINKLNKEKNIFVGYMNPHPLEEKIKLRIKLEKHDITELQTTLKTCSDHLIKLYISLRDNLLQLFEKKVVIKPKQKLKIKVKSKTSTSK